MDHLSLKKLANINVLLINTFEKYGGAARAANRIYMGLQSIGIDSKMLVISKETCDKNVIEVSTLSKKNNLFRILLNKFNDKKIKRSWGRYKNKTNVFVSDIEKSSLKNAIGKLNPDIFHLVWVSSGFVNFQEFKHVNKPILWTMEDCFPFTGVCHYFEQCDKYRTECGSCPILKSNKKEDLSYKVFRQKAARYKTLDLYIVSPSKWLAEKAKESKLLCNRPVYVIPNCLDTNVFSPVQKNVAKEVLKLDGTKKTILFGAIFATIDERKGFTYLESALEKLQSAFKQDEIELLIFGASNYSQKKHYFRTLYLGQVNDDLLLKIAYSAADVMVVPSIQEAFGQTATEAISCATPVVAFDGTGLSDIVDHKVNGYLAKPFEAEDLALGMKWCLENNSNLELSVSARAKAVKVFDSEVVAQQYKDLYTSILNKL
jgi:glycosyltransferase involved in cell wall biosynthesis